MVLAVLFAVLAVSQALFKGYTPTPELPITSLAYWGRLADTLVLFVLSAFFFRQAGRTPASK